MLIRYLNNGKTDHCENQLGKSLITAGIAELVEGAKENRTTKLPQPGDAKLAPPEWSVGPYQTHERTFLAIMLRTGNGLKQSYSGNPQDLHARSFVMPVPDAIREQYSKRWSDEPYLQDQFWPVG